MQFTNEELKGILQKHEEWLRGAGSGERADLTGADLARAGLAFANLARANLTDANLTDADLTGANLALANLTDANLAGANLTDADLALANLTGADLDYSTLYFACKSLSAKFSNKIIIQILYHAAMPTQHNALALDDDVKALFNSEQFRTVVNKFHRVEECGAFTGCKEKEREL